MVSDRRLRGMRARVVRTLAVCTGVATPVLASRHRWSCRRPARRSRRHCPPALVARPRPTRPRSRPRRDHRRAMPSQFQLSWPLGHSPVIPVGSSHAGTRRGGGADSIDAKDYPRPAPPRALDGEKGNESEPVRAKPRQDNPKTVRVNADGVCVGTQRRYPRRKGRLAKLL